MNSDIFQIIDDPSLKDAGDMVINSLAKEQVVTLQGFCSVDYEGRAKSSETIHGYYTVILKSDGTTLVHSNEQYKPMNWQTEGSNISIDFSEESLIITSTDSTDSLTITFEQLFVITGIQSTTGDKLELEGTEDDMHEYIMDNPSVIEDQFTAVENEREYPFGRVDIYGIDDSKTPVIIEVKRRKITRDHMNQLYMYLTKYSELHSETPRGILVGPSCSKYLLDEMEDYNIEFVQLNPRSI